MASNVLGNVEVPVRKLDKACVLNVTVKITNEFKFRIWISLRLIKLAWWIAGGRVEVKEES
jgi:hypothetical protein